MITIPSIISHLDTGAREALKDVRDLYFKWLVASTVLVAVGVILEVVELSINRRLTRRSRPHPNWLESMTIFASILVAAGVAGEVALEIQVSAADTLIQAFDSVLLADTQRFTSVANESAEEAKAQAAASNLARVQLVKNMQWRHLTTAQADTFCRAMPPESKLNILFVNITSISGDIETTEYADEFIAALRECTKSRRHPFSRTLGASSPGPLFGVWIKYRAGPDSPNATPGSIVEHAAARRSLAASVAKSLAQSGVSVSGIDTSGWILEIYVGPRPPLATDAKTVPP